ncbi:MAG: hypothetical protein ACLUVC_13170 [Longibaculum sp.]
MRQGVTKLIGLDISSKIFNTFDEALKEANAIKAYVTRMIDKENERGNKYSAFVVIGISENNSHLGKIALLRNGMRGRPKKVFIVNSKDKDMTNPHLHILVYGNPADMICNRISERLKKKYQKNICWKKYCNSYPQKAFNYIFNQSRAVRTVKRNRYNLLDTNQFQALVDSANEHERIIFTKNEYENVDEMLDIYGVLNTLSDLFELVCNKPITYLITNKKYILSTFNFYLKYFLWKQAP